MLHKNVFISAVVAGFMMSSGTVLAAPTFIGLGELPGGFSGSALAISGDGSTVVGAAGAEAVRWTVESGTTGLGDLPGGAFYSQATAVSGDGAVVVGSGYSSSGQEAFRWTANSGMTGLGDLGGGAFQSMAYGVSADGTKVAGRGSSSSIRTEPFLWTAGIGMAALGAPPTGNFYGWAEGISADGSTVVGFGSSASIHGAFRWTAETGMVGLGELPGGAANSYAYAASADGSVIVGMASSSGAIGFEAFRWTAQSGMVGLGDLPGGALYAEARAVSADGSIAVGWGTTESGNEAFIWDATHGMRELDQVLTNDYGLDLTGWTLLNATGISADGLVIVGNGIHQGFGTEAWIADLRRADVCSAGCPFSTIQAAIDAAATGEIITVDPGTYHERIVIAKQVTVESVQGATTTIIDATGLGGSVVTIGAGATLRGFTVTGGQASHGAGILVNGLAYIRRNTIHGNSASSNGGGIYVYSYAEITGNNIHSNSAAVYGGGINIDRDSVIVNLKYNILRANTADYGGGLAISSAYVTADIEDNIFRENSAISAVSAMNMPATSTLTIDRNVYFNNPGIAVYAHANSTATMKNALLIGNGTAIHMAPDSQAKVVNSTIVGNTTMGISAANTCQAACPEAINSIIWGNATDVTGLIDVSYSVLGSSLPGAGNIVADPLFVDPTSGNYKVQAGSPAIDTGKNTLAHGVTADYASVVRPQDGDGNGAGGTGDGSDYDIGAYEYVSP